MHKVTSAPGQPQGKKNIAKLTKGSPCCPLPTVPPPPPVPPPGAPRAWWGADEKGAGDRRELDWEEGVPTHPHILLVVLKALKSWYYPEKPVFQGSTLEKPLFLCTCFPVYTMGPSL
jgi:hypothetical protein